MQPSDGVNFAPTVFSMQAYNDRGETSRNSNNSNGSIGVGMVEMSVSSAGASGAPSSCSSVTDTVGSLFGIALPGQPVITEVKAVDSTRWTVVLEQVPSTFMVFLLCDPQSLPAGFGIGVYIARQGEGLFQYIGQLSQQRPSSLFNLPACYMTTDRASSLLVLGLSLESMTELSNLGDTQHQPLAQAEAVTRVAVAERVLQDLYNFLVSYARCVGPSQTIETPNTEAEYIVLPASFVNKWRERVQKKVQKDATFFQ